MKRILYHPWCWEPVNLLRNKLQEITNETIYCTKDSSLKNIVINYGRSDAPEDCAHNPGKFVKFCSNKLLFSKLLTENGFITPQFYNDINDEIPENVSFPCLIRESLHLSNGRGIHPCRNLEEFISIWRPNFYWTPFFNLKSEYRVHVLGGIVERIFKKIRGENLEPEEFPIRNFHNGYTFFRKNVNAFPKLVDSVTQFHKTFGASFYTIDLGWNGENFVYIEANSGSGLSEPDAILYANYLAKVIWNIETPEEMEEEEDGAN